MESHVGAKRGYQLHSTRESYPDAGNSNSQRKKRSSKNMNFLGISRVLSNPRKGREGPGKVIRWEKVQVTVAEGGAGVAEEAAAVEEGEVTLATGPPRSKIKPGGVITTGNEDMTRKWRGGGRHPRNVISTAICCDAMRTEMWFASANGTWGTNLKWRYLEEHLPDLFLGSMDEFDKVVRQSHIYGGRRINLGIEINTRMLTHQAPVPC